jgi:hypothetical protein
MEKTCVLCPWERYGGTKYCRLHRDGVLKEIAKADPRPSRPAYRPRSAREDTYSTKYGRTG